MMRLGQLLLLLLLAGCTSPAYDVASVVAPRCPGYHQYYQCEPWARSFQSRMKAQGYAVTLVGFEWRQHGEHGAHLMAFWHDKNGWWARDNFRAPAQVDSFCQYSWDERINNAVNPRGNPVSYQLTNVRIVP